MQNEIDLTKSKEISTDAQNANAWGGGPTISKKELVIPKILPLQHMSEKVADKLGEYGQFRDTSDNKLFGDLKTPFEFIPVYMEKKWVESDIVTNSSGKVKKTFKQIIPIIDNPSDAGYNDELPYREDGIERDRVLDFYVLIPEELGNRGALPYVISFRRTSLKAGSKLATQMYVKNGLAGKPPAGTVCTMSGKDVSNDDGSYIVQDVAPARETSPEELTEAFKWFQLIKGGGAKVDESDNTEKTTPDPTAGQATKQKF
jgi:hypothetical protein